MKRLKILNVLLVFGLLIAESSCADFLDVNTDPNNPSSVPENLQLSALESNFSYNIIGNTAVRIPSHWVQQLSFNGVPPSDDNYDVDESDVNNLWEFWAYTAVMNNTRKLYTQADADSNFAYSGIARIIEAWTLNVVTDLWNEAPYSEAFNPSNTTPAYDNQEAIYNNIFALLEQAIEDLQKDSPMTPSQDDLLYNGDLTKWLRLAYVLTARVNIHLTEAPNNDATTRAQNALDALKNGFMSNDDDADFAYYDKTGEENPWYQWVIDGKWDTRDQLSANYVNLLKSLDDPRLPIQARPIGAVDNNGLVIGADLSNPEYDGHANGEQGEGAVNISSIGSFYSAADAPLNWISYAEAKFIQAEATFITQGANAADPVYRDAIRASMSKLGVSSADAENYINNRPALTDATALEEIMTQKYIANFLSLDVYNDWRRTGYPQLTPVTNEVKTPSGIIPVRFPYPASELNNNSANVKNTGVPVGYGSMEIPVWWDTTP